MHKFFTLFMQLQAVSQGLQASGRAAIMQQSTFNLPFPCPLLIKALIAPNARLIRGTLVPLTMHACMHSQLSSLEAPQLCGV